MPLAHPNRRLAAVATLALAGAMLAAPAAAVAATSHRVLDVHQVATAPRTGSAVAGYVWSDGTSAPSYYAYNSVDHAPGSVAITQLGTGEYDVMFADMGAMASSALPQVTTYDSSDDCRIAAWAPNAGSLQVDVYCFTLVTGSADSVNFDLLVTRPTAHVNGVFDDSFVYKSNASGTLTQSQYNSSHLHNSVRYLGTGRYQVTLGGPASKGTHGIVKVSAYGSAPGGCELVSWTGTTTGELVDVNCFGAGSTRANSQFLVTYVTTNNLMAYNGMSDANAFDNQPQAVYAPPDQYDNTPGSKVTIVKYENGDYEVLAAGSSGGRSGFGGDVQVNAVGPKADQCFVEDWSQEYTPAIYVSCVNRAGDRVGSPFDIEWVVP